MRHPVLLIFINAMILIVVFALMTQSLVVIQRIASADVINGRIEVQRSGKGDFKLLAKGDLIKTGDVVRSSKASTAEFKWADGTRWKIMPLTEITVKKSIHNAIKKSDDSQLKLTAGKVFVRIVKALRPTSTFQVETPTAVAAVRGTIFSVTYQNGKSEVAVFKGRVAVSSKGEDGSASESIEPGHAAVSTAPGDLCERDDSADAQAFRQQKSIILPDLEARLETMPNGRLWVSGQAESGDKVTVNGRVVRVMGNGVFRQSVKTKTPGELISVVATDKHGARAVKVLRTQGMEAKPSSTTH
jgi:hypothetical protein